MAEKNSYTLLLILACVAFIAATLTCMSIMVNDKLDKNRKVLESINVKLDENLSTMSNTVNEWQDAKRELIKKRVLKADN